MRRIKNMTKTLIGSATTNSGGVATCNFSSNTSGEHTIIAETVVDGVTVDSTPIIINVNPHNYQLVMNTDKPIIQANEISDIYGTYTDYEEGMEGETLYFYEVFTPNLSLTSTNPIIQSGEKSNIQAKLKDNDGSLVEGERIDFYEIYEPTTLLLTSDKSIIQTNEYSDIQAKLKDADGSLIEGETIYFYKEIEIYETIAEWNTTGYTTSYYPTPLQITGEMKTRISYGGLRIYGSDNDHHYVFLGQGSVTNNENAKIFYRVGSDWVTFKIIIDDGSISLYIDGTLIETKSVDTSSDVSVWGGSSSNPVLVRNVKIEEL